MADNSFNDLLNDVQQPWRGFLDTYAAELSGKHDELDTWEPFWYLENISERIQNAVESEGMNKLLVSLPPQHGKTMLIANWFPVWHMERFPEREILYVTFNNNYAAQQGEKIRKIVQKDDVDVNLGSTKRKTRFNTNSGAHYRAVGAGAMSGGIPGDLIIIDDPFKNYLKAQSQRVRDEVWKMYANDIMPRASKDATVVILMTRWHSDDIIGRILSQDAERKECEYLRYPAFKTPMSDDAPDYLINDYDDRPVVEDIFEAQELDNDPEFEGRAMLNPKMKPARHVIKQKRTQTDNEFSALYQQLPPDRESQIQLWTYDDIEQGRISREWADRPIDELTEELEDIVVGVDPSGGAKDETGIVVCAVDEDGHGYVLDDVSGRLDPRDWADRVHDVYHKWNADVVVAEKNFGGDMVEDVINRDEDDKEHLEYEEVRATRGKKIRAQDVVARYQDHEVHHLGEFPKLEKQMVDFDDDSDSPDRMDAMVWAMKAALDGTGDGFWMVV